MMMVTIKGEISLEQKEMAMEMESVLQEENGEMIVDLVGFLHRVEVDQGQAGAVEEIVGKEVALPTDPILRVESGMMIEVCHHLQKE